MLGTKSNVIYNSFQLPTFKIQTMLCIKIELEQEKHVIGSYIYQFKSNTF